MKKLLLSDLDGTLLNQQDMISLNDALAIKKWQKQYDFMIASGRYYTDIQNLLRQADLQAGMIALNGVIILDKKQQIITYHAFQDNLLLQQIINFCEQHQMIYVVYGLHHVWSRLYSQQIIKQLYYLGQKRATITTAIICYMQQYYDEIYQQFVPITTAFNKFANDSILHIEIFDARSQLITKINHQFGDRLAITTASPVDLEISPPHVGKGSAIKQLQQSYQQIIAIGDGNNDITMLQTADVGIAMANATDDVKRVADWITTNHDHCGIAHAIVRLFNE